MTAALYHRKLARVLDRMGGIYTVHDILSAIAEGKMQSFAVNNTWCVTTIQDYPRVRQLQVIALVGDMKDGEAMHARIVAYAKEIGAGLISANGRTGWSMLARGHGWRIKAKTFLFQLET